MTQIFAQETLVKVPVEESWPVMPFIFQYLTLPVASPLPSCTDPTAGYETRYETNWDSQTTTDYADDTDETDADPETGVLADSGSEEDEE